MSELVYLKNEEAVCDSLQVAEKFRKRHADVIRSVENLIKNDSTQNCVRCFKKSNYKDAKGEQRPMYIMNRDGFTFLVMGFTGKEAMEWKWQYIKAFNQMENIIHEKSETDNIHKLVEYAKEQGSSHAEMLYMTYSKLANKMAGISKRDEATVIQLNNLSLMEHILLHEIDLGIMQGTHYKDIYRNCKKRLEMLKDIAYLESA